MSRSLWAVFWAAIFGITSLGIPQVLSCIGEGDQCVSTGGEVFSTTSGTLSLKLRDLPVGKLIQIGDATNGLKFVKVGENQYLSVSPGCADPVLTTTGSAKNFDYTGNVQSYTAYAGCEYKLEVWGAQGGNTTYATQKSGAGGYSYGNYMTSKKSELYVVVGEMGKQYQRQDSNLATGNAYNGGGSGRGNTGGGGGATHIALRTGELSTLENYKSDVLIVAGAGGGTSALYGDMYGGGTTAGPGKDANYSYTKLATLTAATTNGPGTNDINPECNGSFGKGGDASGASGSTDAGGGGAGYYGGASTNQMYWSSGGGGSGFVSSLLTSGQTIAGNASIPNPRGSGTITGNTGHGYARITRLN